MPDIEAVWFVWGGSRRRCRGFQIANIWLDVEHARQHGNIYEKVCACVALYACAYWYVFAYACACIYTRAQNTHTYAFTTVHSTHVRAHTQIHQKHLHSCGLVSPPSMRRAAHSRTQDTQMLTEQLPSVARTYCVITPDSVNIAFDRILSIPASVASLPIPNPRSFFAPSPTAHAPPPHAPRLTVSTKSLYV